MPTRLKKSNIRATNEDISVIYSNSSNDFTSTVKQQIKKTILSSVNLLQQIQPGIYLFSIKKNRHTTPLDLKKLSDRVQYALLPSEHDNSVFCKLSLNNIKNQCYGEKPASWLINLAHQEIMSEVHLYFYFHLNEVQKLIDDALGDGPLYIREILSNRTIIFADQNFNYPFAISKLPALALWLETSLAPIIQQEIAKVSHKLLLVNKLFAELKTAFTSSEWSLYDGQMRLSHKGITKTFDYANLLDDIIHAEREDSIKEYLSNFHVNDLDTSSCFPTVSVRSPVYLKARPRSLASMENGYAIVAAKEGFGKQTVIDADRQQGDDAFSLWLMRAERHLFRHQYKARVVFAPDGSKSAFSLVGEQVATIGIFPGLVKGIFEALNLKAPKTARVIAHNEDVLTIAHDTTSWIDINAVNLKATSLFRLVCSDGSDPLSLFEQIVLPEVGVGNFQLQIVPDPFFELIETARAMKHSMPPGHDHYLVGLAYECLHEWGLAVLEFQKALRLDASDPDILHALGCALMEIGQVSEAMPFLKRAFDMMPEDPEVANNWGKSSLECGHVADAITAFERAVRLSPGSADYLKNLGDGYLLAARPTDALTILNKAIRCDPHLAEAHATLANLHLSIGDEQSAKKHALLAYKENPVDANIANLLWRLTLQKNK